MPKAATSREQAALSLRRRAERSRVVLSLHIVSMNMSYACRICTAVTPAPRNVLLEDALGRKMADNDERRASGKVVILNLDSSPGQGARGGRRLPLRDASRKRSGQF